MTSDELISGIEEILQSVGYIKGTDDYNSAFDRMITLWRKFGVELL